MGYPIVFFCIFAPQSSVRLWEFFGTPPTWYKELAEVCFTLNGVGNFLVYGATRGVLTKMNNKSKVSGLFSLQELIVNQGDVQNSKPAPVLLDTTTSYTNLP